MEIKKLDQEKLETLLQILITTKESILHFGDYIDGELGLKNIDHEQVHFHIIKRAVEEKLLKRELPDKFKFINNVLLSEIKERPIEVNPTKYKSVYQIKTLVDLIDSLKNIVGDGEYKGYNYSTPFFNRNEGEVMATDRCRFIVINPVNMVIPKNFPQLPDHGYPDYKFVYEDHTIIKSKGLNILELLGVFNAHKIILQSITDETLVLVMLKDMFVCLDVRLVFDVLLALAFNGTTHVNIKLKNNLNFYSPIVFEDCNNLNQVGAVMPIDPKAVDQIFFMTETIQL